MGRSDGCAPRHRKGKSLLRLRSRSTGVEHRNGRIVRKQLLRREDVLGELGLQRLQPPDGSANPVSECRGGELDTLASEDLALPIKRKVIAILGDQHLGEEGGLASPLPIGRSWA